MVLHNLADLIFGPMRDLLTSVVASLSNMSLVAARGLNPALYLGPFAVLGPAWLGLIKQIFLGATLFAILLIGRAGYSLYLQIKAGVKWW